MKKYKLSQLLILLILIASLSMTGCSPVLYGNTVMGDCSLNVAFLNVLANSSEGSFQAINEDIRGQVEIKVELQNIITERKYLITLNPANGYFYTAKLNPGTYRVIDVDGSMSKYTGMHLSAGSDTVELVRGNDSSNLSIYIDNEEEFLAFQNNLKPEMEIITTGRFSRKLWMDSEIIDIQDVTNHISVDSDTMVKPYAKCDIHDEAKGIKVTYLNDSSEVRSWRACKVIGITLDKSCALLPGGVTLGMKTETVCNKDTGLYGEPHGFEGVAIYGLPIGDLRAVYKDQNSGDKLSLQLDSMNGYITGITYELEVYE